MRNSHVSWTKSWNQYPRLNRDKLRRNPGTNDHWSPVWNIIQRLYISYFFKDPHQPLTYQFHYKTDHGLYTVVQYGSTDHVSTVLPSGKRNGGYIIDFEILITDSLSASSNYVLHVKVTVLVLASSVWNYKVLLKNVYHCLSSKDLMIRVRCKFSTEKLENFWKFELLATRTRKEGQVTEHN